MEAYWTQFAKSGDPNSTGFPEWPAWNNDTEPFLEFGVDGRVTAQRDFAPIFCNLSPDRLRARLK
jgi:para-nitrobenzyl esterase